MNSILEKNKANICTCQTFCLITEPSMVLSMEIWFTVTGRIKLFLKPDWLFYYMKWQKIFENKCTNAGCEYYVYSVYFSASFCFCGISGSVFQMTNVLSVINARKTDKSSRMDQVRFQGHLLFHCSSTVLGIRRSSRHDWSSGSSIHCFLHVYFWVCNDVGCVALVLFEMPLLATALSVIMEHHFRLSILLKIYIAEC
jgi:hypothetical protein